MKPVRRRCKCLPHKIKAGYKSDFLTFLLGLARKTVPKMIEHSI